MLNLFIAVIFIFNLFACASHQSPSRSLEQPPSRKLRHHTVSRGETLYSIAWRYGKDFKELARINRIASPYRIFPGQRLQLRGSARLGTVVAPVPSVSKPRTEHKATAVTSKALSLKTPKPLTVAQPRKSISNPNRSAIRWRWPVKGRLIASFQAKNPMRKGIDIAGKKGEAVYAAADGAVIYAGSALRGYGKLLIVKHSEEFLSAYAHNHRLVVGEGVKVKVGQRIAEMGSSGADRDMLHFEIRRNGQPVDPLVYLP